jgi:hypothetical protein
MDEILCGETKIDDIPIIKVYWDGEHYYSQNNRRLFLFKWCQSNGLITSDYPFIKARAERLRPNKKYSPLTCSLKATIVY